MTREQGVEACVGPGSVPAAFVGYFSQSLGLPCEGATTQLLVQKIWNPSLEKASHLLEVDSGSVARIISSQMQVCV